MQETQEVVSTAAAKSEKKPAAEDPKKNGAGGGSGGKGPKKASVAAIARALLKKKCGLDVVKPSFSQLPHIPSGSIVINNLIGGSKSGDGKGAVCPGYPRKRITEMYGAESCGKTTLALAAAVECQKAGGVVAFLDFEHALVDSYARKIGVSYNDEQWLLYKPNTFEEGATAITLLVKAGVDLVIVDSVASMVPKDEYEKEADDAERIGSLAAPLTRFLKKLVMRLDEGAVDKTLSGTAIIFINQTRAKIGGYGGGDEDQTPGGKALKFYSSMRLRMTRIKSEVIKKKDAYTGKDINIPYGNVTQVKVVKTKIDLKQGQQGVIFIRYGLGLDNVMAVIENGIRFKLIKKDGAFFAYGDFRSQGRENFRKTLLENPKMLAELQSKVVNAMFDSSTDVTPDEKAEQTEEAQLLAEIESSLGDDAAFSGDAEEDVEADVSEDVSEES